MNLNWTNLVTEGRARDVGIAWEPEELEALVKLSNDAGLNLSEAAKFMREGITTVEALEEAKAAGVNPKGREHLEADATKAGVKFSDETPDSVLKSEIARKNKEAEADVPPEEMGVDPEEENALDAEADVPPEEEKSVEAPVAKKGNGKGKNK